jgi:hypothetical protein
MTIFRQLGFPHGRVPSEKYAVTLSYLFAGSVLENQNTHAVMARYLHRWG